MLIPLLRTAANHFRFRYDFDRHQITGLDDKMPKALLETGIITFQMRSALTIYRFAETCSR